MPYQQLASASAPALIVYLIDLSASMTAPLGDKRRIDVVNAALDAAVRTMLQRSTRGLRVSPRYRLAIYGYSDEVMDVLGGVRTITEVASMVLPTLETFRTTRTADAFAAAEDLLRDEWDSLQAGPAPLVCHLTDGLYTGDDPEPAAKRLKAMAVPDGNVLVENIFISDDILDGLPEDLSRWQGILPATALKHDYAHKLRSMSSPLPESYREVLEEYNYRLHRDAVMMLPGISAELVSMGFQMSQATR